MQKQIRKYKYTKKSKFVNENKVRGQKKNSETIADE